MPTYYMANFLPELYENGKQIGHRERCPTPESVNDSHVSYLLKLSTTYREICLGHHLRQIEKNAGLLGMNYGVVSTNMKTMTNARNREKYSKLAAQNSGYVFSDTNPHKDDGMLLGNRTKLLLMLRL